MLDGLEGADGPVELHSLFGVGDGRVQSDLGGAHAVGHQGDEHAVHDSGDGVGGVARAEPASRRVVERHCRLGARAVDRWHLLDCDPGRARVDREDADAAAVAPGDEQHVGGRRIGDERLGAGQRAAVGCRCDVLPVPGIPFGQGDGRDQRAVGDGRQQVGAAVGGDEHRRSGDSRGEEGPGVDRPTELLEHDAHLHHAHARPAVLGGYEQSGGTQLGKALPHRVGRAPGVAVEVAHVRLDRRLLGEEAADGGPQGLLLV